MVFTTISKKAPMFGTGKLLDQNYFETKDGVKLFFYDTDSITDQFGKFGLVEISEINEPNKSMANKPSMPFLMITCKKAS
ncbi:hypothetical protein D1872_306810 [compost metagenome]